MNKGGCKTGRKGETPNGGCKIGKKNPTKTRERRRANTPQLESLPTTPIDRPKKKKLIIKKKTVVEKKAPKAQMPNPKTVVDVQKKKPNKKFLVITKRLPVATGVIRSKAEKKARIIGKVRKLGKEQVEKKQKTKKNFTAPKKLRTELLDSYGLTNAEANKMDATKLFGMLPPEIGRMILTPSMRGGGLQVGRHNIKSKVKYILEEGKEQLNTMRGSYDYESTTQANLYGEIVGRLDSINKSLRRKGTTEARKTKLLAEQVKLVDEWSKEYVKEHNEQMIGNKGGYYFVDFYNPPWLEGKLKRKGEYDKKEKNADVDSYR